MRTGVLEPTTFLNSIDFHGALQIADLGCGSGHLAIEMARRVGRGGTVHTFDVQQSALEIVRREARSANIYNIETLWTDLETRESTRLAPASMDLVVIANVLFQSEKKEVILAEAARIVKSSGSVLIVEWLPGLGGIGPNSHVRIPKDSLKLIAEKVDLTFDRDVPAGSHHYATIFKKA